MLLWFFWLSTNTSMSRQSLLFTVPGEEENAVEDCYKDCSAWHTATTLKKLCFVLNTYVWNYAISMRIIVFWVLMSLNLCIDMCLPCLDSLFLFYYITFFFVSDNQKNNNTHLLLPSFAEHVRCYFLWVSYYFMHLVDTMLPCCVLQLEPVS